MKIFPTLVSIAAMILPLEAGFPAKVLEKLANRSALCFECSHLALLMKDEKVSNALIKQGYKDGKAFFFDDFDSDVILTLPAVFASVGGTKDTSPEFVLGRIYEKMAISANTLRAMHPDQERLEKAAKEELGKRLVTLALLDDEDNDH